MAYTTQKPTGMSIKRSGSNFVVTWKIGDKDYSEGQTFQYRIGNGKWQDVAIGNSTTKKTIAVNASSYFPTTKKLLTAIHVRIRGRRKDFKSGNDTINPQVSAWAEKTYDVKIPNKPKLSVALSADYSNVCTFTWTTETGSDKAQWFTKVQCQTALVAKSNITDGSKLPHSVWTTNAATSANGSVTITEDSSVINQGVAYTRWYRMRAQGPQGNSDWVYAKHVYAVPYQAKNVKAGANATDAGGYLCRATWTTPRAARSPRRKSSTSSAT